MKFVMLSTLGPDGSARLSENPERLREVSQEVEAMGWQNPPIPWSQFERTLSDRRRPRQMPANADGGDSPAWSLRRGRGQARAT